MGTSSTGTSASSVINRYGIVYSESLFFKKIIYFCIVSSYFSALVYFLTLLI